jgi:diacylglycerol kinase family enzyme
MDGVCMLPYGTANDLGRIMGWGQKPKPIWTRKMKTLIEEIINASSETFNIWEIKVFLRDT